MDRNHTEVFTPNFRRQQRLERENGRRSQMIQGSWKSRSVALVVATGLALGTLGLSACGGGDKPAEQPAAPAAAAKDAAATAVGKVGEAAQAAGDAVKKAADEAEKEMKKDQ